MINLTDAACKSGYIDEVKNKRFAFAVVDGVVYFQSRGDYRPMCQYMQEEYGISEDILSDMLRGFYDDDGNVVFFSGYEHADACVSYITKEIVDDIVKVVKPGVDTIKIWNGVNKGEVGELWEPKLMLYTICR